MGQKEEAKKSELKPLKVAVALGGGASKGFAHIGVLQVLEREGIPLEIVTGTSAGSIVGSLYSYGYTPEDIKVISANLSKLDFIDFSFSSSGFVKGNKLEAWINEKMDNLLIENLPREFAAIATNFSTGDEHIFRNGNIGRAVRASSSIPSLFQPVEIEGELYVDGGLSAPIPVNAARTLGADFVIAVDVSQPPEKKPDNGMISNLMQTISIMNIRLCEMELDKADIVICPDIEKYGTFKGFDELNEAIEKGVVACEAMLPEIYDKLKNKYREINRIPHDVELTENTHKILNVNSEVVKQIRIKRLQLESRIKEAAEQIKEKLSENTNFLEEGTNEPSSNQDELNESKHKKEAINRKVISEITENENTEKLHDMRLRNQIKKNMESGNSSNRKDAIDYANEEERWFKSKEQGEEKYDGKKITETIEKLGDSITENMSLMSKAFSNAVSSAVAKIEESFADRESKESVNKESQEGLENKDKDKDTRHVKSKDNVSLSSSHSEQEILSHELEKSLDKEIAQREEQERIEQKLHEKMQENNLENNLEKNKEVCLPCEEEKRMNELIHELDKEHQSLKDAIDVKAVKEVKHRNPFKKKKQ